VYGRSRFRAAPWRTGRGEVFDPAGGERFCGEGLRQEGCEGLFAFQAFANNLCAALALSVPDKAASIGLSGIMTFASSIATLRCQQAGGKSCVVAISFCAMG